MIDDLGIKRILAAHQMIWDRKMSSGDAMILKEECTRHTTQDVIEAMHSFRRNQQSNTRPTPAQILAHVTRSAQETKNECAFCKGEGGESHFIYPLRREEAETLGVLDSWKHGFVRPEVGQQLGIRPHDYWFWCATCAKQRGPTTRMIQGGWSAGRFSVETRARLLEIAKSGSTNVRVSDKRESGDSEVR